MNTKSGHSIKWTGTEGYAVDLAYDSERSYDLASSETYSVIVLDLTSKMTTYRAKLR
jgi:DNA-binding response OmpR family regulator